ncbi:MAG: hypothetical protein RR133_01610 [Kiritimatiellia bacterium]
MRVVGVISLLLLCAGCASTTQTVDLDHDVEITVSVDAKDIDEAAAEFSDSLLVAPRLGGTEETPAVLALGRVTNDTCQHLDVDVLLTKIAQVLIASDRFEVSSVFAARADQRDQMVTDARLVRGNAEFEAATVQRRGTLHAPTLSLSGKIVQRNVRRDNGGTRIEYFFTLKVTRISDGVVLWQKSRQIVKAVAKGMPLW